MKLKFGGAVILATVISTALAQAINIGEPSSAQTGAPLVYICPGEQGSAAPTCTNSQEFEVFDHNGSPIFSVGEYGGSAVFGDNSSVYPPGNVYDPSVVQSYTTPATYGSTSCKAPAVWIAPQGLWTCTSTGTWAKRDAF